MKQTGTVPLTTPRLLLRRFCDGDAPDMLRNWSADAHVQGGYGEPVYDTPQAVGALINRWQIAYAQPDCYRWAITLAGSGENIGQIALCRVYDAAGGGEYALGQAFWGGMRRRGAAPCLWRSGL